MHKCLKIDPIDFRIITKDGQQRWIGHICQKVFNDTGEFTGIRGSNRNITLQKEIEMALVTAKENAEAADYAKSVFLANMSHELRTPLNAILGYTQIFAGDSSLNSQQQSGIKTMHQAGEHLLMLINDILDLSKIEAGKMELVETEFPLPEFFRGVADIIKIRSKRKKIDFRYEPAKMLPAAICFDELRLRQVLLNLLSNAVKFTKQQGMCILRVSSDMRPSGRVMLQFDIEDNGVGIPQAMQEKVFAPFQQVGDRLQYSAGSGLGLSISRKLVQMMGGELQLVSPLHNKAAGEAGSGSLFSFVIEAAVVANVPAMASLSPTVTGYSTTEKEEAKKILIVDDIASNREVLQNTLTPIGFEIAAAEDGSKVLAACKRSRPDLILMDLRMPKVDGFAALTLLKNTPIYADIPVIAITAFSIAVQGLKTRCLEQGFSAYLTKPYSVPELLETLAKHLQIQLEYTKNDVPKTVAADTLVMPAEDLLLQLRELLALGDIDSLAARADELARKLPEYHGFAKRIAQMTEEFQLTELEGFLATPQEDE